MSKNVNNKMITNSQLSTTEPKKLSKQPEPEQGNKKHKWQVQNREAEVNNSKGNGEAKELV